MPTDIETQSHINDSCEGAYDAKGRPKEAGRSPKTNAARRKRSIEISMGDVRHRRRLRGGQRSLCPRLPRPGNSATAPYRPGESGGDRVPIRIPAGPLADVLRAFERVTGTTVTLAIDSIGTIQSPGVSGSLTAEQALRAMLVGTSVRYRLTSIDIGRARSCRGLGIGRGDRPCAERGGLLAEIHASRCATHRRRSSSFRRRCSRNRARRRCATRSATRRASR